MMKKTLMRRKSMKEAMNSKNRFTIKKTKIKKRKNNYHLRKLKILSTPTMLSSMSNLKKVKL